MARLRQESNAGSASVDLTSKKKLNAPVSISSDSPHHSRLQPATTMEGEKQSNRSHRAPKSGNKADKKGTSKKLPDRGQNPKVSLPSAPGARWAS